MFLNMSKKGWFEDGVFIQPKFMKFLSGIGMTMNEVVTTTEPSEEKSLNALLNLYSGLNLE